MSVPNDYELNPEQEAKILAYWNRNPDKPPGIDELTQYVFDDKTLDGRSNAAKAVKRCLARHNLKATTKTKYDPVGGITELSEEHKEFIRNNVKTMTAVNLANELFKTPDRKPLDGNSAEVRLIKQFIQTLDTRLRVVEDEDSPMEDYRPPKTLEQALARVNKYVDFVGDFKKLNAGQKRGLNALIGYLHTNRFLRQINFYDDNKDRTTLEDVFIRCTYDKHDLTQEEVDQFIIYASEAVNLFHIQSTIASLRGRQEEDLQAMSEGEGRAKMTMAFVDAIGKAETEKNQCIKRQNDLLDSLKEKRSKRITHERSDNTFLNLFQLWKNEETRKDLIEIGKAEQKEIAEEVDRLSTMDDIRAKILGISKEEILNG